MILRDYQTSIANAASELLKKHKIAYLAMQVRTGKTLTSLYTAQIYGAQNVLFITKKKAISSILSDFDKSEFAKYQLTVINFEQLHNLTKYAHFDLIIIDEAHSLGQYPIPSERTKLLKQIAYNKPIIYLSGTPSPESYSQLFHQLWVSTFSPFGHSNFYQWVKHGYVNVKQRFVFNRSLNDYSDANKSMIDEKVSHLFLNYTQEEAGFKENVQEHVHYVKMNAKTYEIISRLKRDKILIGKDKQVVEADTEVKLMNKLHQLYSGTVIYDSNPDDTTGGAVIDQSKTEYIFNTFSFDKMAIFYKFRSEYYLIKLKALFMGYKVTDNPQEFNESSDKIVFISQFVSGREGINLEKADCLICYNIDFSAVTYWQCRARIQSKDRDKSAALHWIFAEDGIEDKILKAVQNKKNYTLSYFKKDYIQ